MGTFKECRNSGSSFQSQVHFPVTLICHVSGMLCERWYVFLKGSWAENLIHKKITKVMVRTQAYCFSQELHACTLADEWQFLQDLTAITSLLLLFSPFLLLSHRWACSPRPYSQAMGHKNWDMTLVFYSGLDYCLLQWEKSKPTHHWHFGQIYLGLIFSCVSGHTWP